MSLSCRYFCKLFKSCCWSACRNRWVSLRSLQPFGSEVFSYDVDTQSCTPELWWGQCPRSNSSLSILSQSFPCLCCWAVFELTGFAMSAQDASPPFTIQDSDSGFGTPEAEAHCSPKLHQLHLPSPRGPGRAGGGAHQEKSRNRQGMRPLMQSALLWRF